MMSALVTTMALAETNKSPPTDHDLHSLPDEIGPWKISRALIDGEPVGLRNWPLWAEYGGIFNARSDRRSEPDAKLQCFGDTSTELFCSGAGERKVKVGGAPACYTPPEDKDGALITWYDGKWSCVLSFPHPFYVRSAKKEEIATVTKHASDVVAAIHALRDSGGADTSAHVAAIEAVRVKRQR